MYPNPLSAEFARQRIADRLAQAAHQRLVRQAHLHTTGSHPTSSAVPALIALARRIGLARQPAHASS